MKKITLLLLLLFTSLSSYSQLALEGFESTTGPNSLPSTNWTLSGTNNWAVFDNGVGTGNRWGINAFASTIPYQGTNCASVNRENVGAGNSSEDYLSTPLVTIPTNGQLHFFTRTFFPGNQGTLFQIKVAPATASQTNPAAYTLVQQWTEVDLTTTYNVYEEKVVSLAAYAGQQVYISFVKIYNQPSTVTGLDGDRWLIDNVSVVQQCLDPTTLAANGITQTSANLSWANPSGATSWEVEVIPSAGTPTGVGTVYNGTLPYTVTATTAGAVFTPSTAYKYYVRALCSSGASSLWVGPFLFTTTSPGLTCAAPITIGSLPYSTTDDTANYGDTTDVSQPAACAGTATNYMTGNDVFYAYTPTTTGVISITMTPTGTWSGIFVYDGCANVGVTCVAGVANTGNGVRSIPSISVVAGHTYIIVISTNTAPQTVGYTMIIQTVNCPPPTTGTASNITQTGAQLSWANPGGATSWEVAVQTAGSAIPSGSGVTASTNTNFNVPGLTSGTAYQYYVRADCGTGTFSAWAGPYLFNTPICNPTQQCNYTFVVKDGFGDGWNGGTMQVRQNGIVVATLTGPTAAQGTTPVNVTVALCDGIPYDLFWNNAGTFPTEMGVTVINSFNQTLFVKLPGTGTAGTVLYSNTTNCLVPECLPPTNLTATLISQTDATLGWTTTGPESSWQVFVQVAGLPAPTATSIGWVAAPTNPFVYTGLTSGTSYDFYVRPVCSSTSIGQSSIVKNFSTSICPLANQCNYTFIVSDAFGDGWNGGILQVRQNGIVVATLTGPTAAQGTTPQTVFVPLCHGVPFDLFVSAAGSFPTEMGVIIKESLAPQQVIFTKPAGTGTLTTGTILYAGTAECIPPTCPKPNTLTATNITPTSAMLGWTEAGSAIKWEVIALPFGSPAPLLTSTGITVNTNPAIITGLIASTAYTFYVRAICSPTDKSLWSIGFNFNTTPINDDCSGAIFAPVNSSGICLQTTAGTIAGATPSSPSIAAPCVGTADDDVWYQFVASNTYLNVSLQGITGSTNNLNFAAYSGQCGSLTQIFCSAANASIGVLNGLVIGQTYFIRVYSNASTPQTSTFTLCLSTPSTCTTATSACNLSAATPSTTGVNSLGTIGCLFSSPDPNFFTIQIQQSGPINYLLTQSTTPGGAANLDVDYAAWGPFTSQAEACVAMGNPVTLAPGIGVPVTQTTGCSFSASATEILNIANAVAGQYYIILITNYSQQPGFITLAQTNIGAPGAGVPACCPEAYFSYTPAVYCKTSGAANPVAVIATTPFSLAGVFSAAPPGLVFANTATGEVDLAASAPGNYLITNFVAATGSCNTNKQESYTITITNPSTATIAYDAAAYCNSDTTLHLATVTGATNGTFSASPQIGLNINPNTGVINPSLSAPGLYTVNYTIAAHGGCPDFVASVPIEILATPNIDQPAPVFACNSYTLTALPIGNYYSQSQLGGSTSTPLDITVPLTTNQTVYIYAVSSGGCTSEKSFTVTINSVPTSHSDVTLSSCATPDGTVTVISPTSQAGALPPDLFISEVTDAQAGSLTYVELYNGTGAALNLASYRIKVYNNGSTTASCNNLLSGTINNNSTVVIAVGSTINLGGVVPNLVFAGCGGVNTNDYIKLTTSADVPVDLWGKTDGTDFTPLNQPGYTYRRLASATHPSLTWNPADWTALDPEDYTNVGIYSLAVSNYEYSLDNGTYQSGTLFSGVSAGNHTITVHDILTGCYSTPENVFINPITPTPTVTTITYTTPVCQNETTPELPYTGITGFTSGGTYSEVTTTGLVINPNTGLIDLANSTAGPHTIKYDIPLFNPITCQSPGFSTFDIVITPTVAQVVGFGYPSTPVSVCQIAQATLTPTLALGFTTGGTFNVTPSTGLSIDATTGVINVTASTAGTYSITYVPPAVNTSICQVATMSTPVVVTINAATLPEVGFNYDTPVCFGDANPGPHLNSGFVTSGSFSSSAGLSINASTGVIDLTTSTPGSYVIDYIIATPNTTTCQLANTGHAPITISGPIQVSITGECQGVQFVLTANPVNSSFVPTAVTYQWHGAEGATVGDTQTIVVTTPGLYSVTVTSNGCTGSDSHTFDSVFCQIQKGISVNADGLNDVFELTGLNVKKLSIFNRYGMIVYDKTSYTNEWKGQSNKGDDLPDGTYYYVIERNNGENKTGWIYINREK